MQQNTATTTYYQYLHADQRGTVHAVTDRSQRILLSYVQDAYGRTLAGVGGSGPSVPNDLIYQTNWLTFDLGGTRYAVAPARIVVLAAGVFTSRDILPGLNKYRAWSSNPVQQVDVAGLQDVDSGRGRWELLLADEWNDPDRMALLKLWTLYKAWWYTSANIYSFGCLSRQDIIERKELRGELPGINYGEAVLWNVAESSTQVAVSSVTGRAGGYLMGQTGPASTGFGRAANQLLGQLGPRASMVANYGLSGGTQGLMQTTAGMLTNDAFSYGLGRTLYTTPDYLYGQFKGFGLGAFTSGVVGGGRAYFGRNNALINLGGEGESPGYVNQNYPGVRAPNYRVARTGQTLHDLINYLRGRSEYLVISSNERLPFRSECACEVRTIGTTVDKIDLLSKLPGIQSREAMQLIAPGGRYVIEMKGDPLQAFFRPASPLSEPIGSP
jgi:hypothetical protein